MNEEGRLRGSAPNLKSENYTILGPVVLTLTNEDGDDQGLCLEHDQAVARALDHYGVGLAKKAN